MVLRRLDSMAKELMCIVIVFVAFPVCLVTTRLLNMPDFEKWSVHLILSLGGYMWVE